MSTRVQVLAIKPGYERSEIYVAPYFDETTRKFIIKGKEYDAELRTHPKTGDEFYCDKAPTKITDKTHFKIEHKMTFDCSKPEDMFLLDILLDSGYLAPNFQSINTGGEHRFYLKDEQQEAIATSTKAERVFDALSMIKLLTGTDKASLAFFFKQPVRTMTEQMIEGYVKNRGLTDPDSVIEALSDKTWKKRAFLEKCVQFGLVTNDGGVYKVGSEVIGIDRDAAIAFISNKENHEFTRQLKASLGKEEGVLTEDAETK